MDEDTRTSTWDQYSDADLLEEAQANAQAAIMATVAFLEEQGVSLDAWAEGMGRRFATVWGAPEPWGAGEFLDAMLTNLRTLGATVAWADLDDETVASATVQGLFDEEMCLLFGTTRADVLVYLSAPSLIAEQRDLVWEWTMDGDDVQIKVRRRDTASTAPPTE